MKIKLVLTLVLIILAGMITTEASALGDVPTLPCQFDPLIGASVWLGDSNCTELVETPDNGDVSVSESPATVVDVPAQESTSTDPVPDPPDKHCNNGGGNGGEGCSPSPNGNNDEGGG